jgi:hypothetical protein
MKSDLSAGSVYIANQAQLVAEIIEGEAIIVHLETGTYYSLRESAAFLWERLQEGSDRADLLAAMKAHFASLPENAELDLQNFLEELLRDGLLIEHTQPLPDTLKHDGAGQAVYSPPMVEKFTDMSDLLLLDPIHEVDEEGWPFKKKSNPS